MVKPNPFNMLTIQVKPGDVCILLHNSQIIYPGKVEGLEWIRIHHKPPKRRKQR